MTADRQVPLAYRILARGILEDAVLYGTRMADRKVFLSSIPGLDLKNPECTNLLRELLHTGALQFARADLVAAMDPGLVSRSEWRLEPTSNGPTYHFIVLPAELL